MNGLPPSDGDRSWHQDHNEPIPPQSLGPPLSPRGPTSSILNNLDSVISRLPQYYSAVTDKSPDRFAEFPSAVIQRILWSTDANGFASLCLLSSTWYHEAQSPDLYAHHLSRCPSYALSNNVITGPFRKNDLARLKAKFAQEVRRNLFDAYLQPRETHINLVSTCANSSAAFPGGEAFRFEFSPNGQTLLAISSSRIYVIDATSDALTVTRELKTSRRALSASVTDDGSLLAVLSEKYRANIYGLTPGQPVQHLQVTVLDNSPRTIALSHQGTVLAAAYEGGIEVFSLSHTALTTDRRSVRCEPVDSLTFSADGSMMVGCAKHLEEPNAVVVSAPFYTENDPNITPKEIHSRMWTSQMLFPQISSTVSHTALLSSHLEGDASWLFAYDHTLMSYRAVKTDDTRTGVAYFLSPPGEERFDDPTPNMLPSVSGCGTLGVAGFDKQGLFVYGIPERLDVSPDMGSVIERAEEATHGRLALTTATGYVEPLWAYSPSISAESEMVDEDGIAGKVDWRQSLFVKCKPIRSIEGCNTAKWVERDEITACGFPGKRLIITAPAGLGKYHDELGGEDLPIDGSRLCLLDFDYSPTKLQHRQITIEVGDKVPELLSEQQSNLESEVLLERRRTKKNRGNIRTQLDRATTSASNSPHTPEAEPVPALPPLHGGLAGLGNAPRANPSRAQTVVGFQQARFPPRPPLGQASFSSDNPHQRPYTRTNASPESPPPPYLPDNVSAVPDMRYGQAQMPTPIIQGQLFPARPATVSGDGLQNSNFSRPPRQHRDADSVSVGEAMQNNRGFQTGARPAFAGGIPEESEAMMQHTTHSAQQPDYMTQSSRSQYPDVSPEESTLGLRSVANNVSPIEQVASDRPRASLIHKNQRLSLTGANLQNRLNHPTPPTPENSNPPTHHRLAGPIQNSSNDQMAHYPDNVMDSPQDTSVPLSQDQLARLHRRSLQLRPQSAMYQPYGRTDVQQLTPIHANTWDIAGSPVAPFQQPWIGPDGVVRSNSRSMQRNSMPVQASWSTPNLLSGVDQHPSRLSHSRLNMVEDVRAVFQHEGASRSQSFDARMMQHENGTTNEDASGFLLGSQGGRKMMKKIKKDKPQASGEQKEKRGFRCNVM